MTFYTRLVRPLLFLGDAEAMHGAALGVGHVLGRVAPARGLVGRLTRTAGGALATEVCGLRFDNPIGLAAGYDKSAVAVDGLAALGFGHLEVGSVSIDPSPGNPKPRLFRLPLDRAVVVNYGLPNDGAPVVAARLAERRTRIPVGVNVVKTNRGRAATAESLGEVLDEYVRAVSTLLPVADYLTLNLSCPNVSTGRDVFADPGSVRELMAALAPVEPRVPIFLKISPLGGVGAIDSVLEAVEGAAFVSGFAFNLAPGKRAALETPDWKTARMPGSLAGKPVERELNEAIGTLYRRMDRRRYRIIGAGGVFSAEDAYRKIRLGASLVQVLTGIVYEGPWLVKRIGRGLRALLGRDGFAGVHEAVGVDSSPS